MKIINGLFKSMKLRKGNTVTFEKKKKSNIKKLNAIYSIKSKSKQFSVVLLPINKSRWYKGSIITKFSSVYKDDFKQPRIVVLKYDCKMS